MDKAVPDYEPMLASFHKAFAAELEAMVASVPIREGDRVLEMACGDGDYTPRLARRVGPSGSVVGVDVSPGYLDLARRETLRSGHPDRSRFVVASIDRLPFDDGSFDVAWCAQSLFSLPEPVEAVRRMARAVRAGGVVAVMEDDTLHRVVLPWPIEVELAVRSAEWEALRDETARPHKFYVGRHLVQVFREAGLVDLHVRAFASCRVAPLEPEARTFLGEYLKDLGERAVPRLNSKMRKDFERLIAPGSPDALLDQPGLSVTIIDHVVHGRVPMS